MIRSPRTVLFWASAAQVANSLLNFGLPAIGPELQEEFSVDLFGLGALLTASLLGSGVALLAVGIAVDRYGGRVTTLVGVGLGAAGLAAAAFASSAAVLFALLFVSGLGMAAIPIAGMSSVFRAYGVAQRGRALGVRQMAVPLGGVIGAVLLPGLEALGGVQLALIVCAGAVAATGIPFALVAEKSPTADKRPPIRLRGVVRAPGMARLLLVAALYIIVLQSFLVYAVPAARDAGFSALLAGVMFFAMNATAGVARIVWGRVADGDGGTRRVRALVGAGWVAAVGAGLFGVALHFGAVAVVVAAAVFAFGALGWNALVYVSAGERSAPELAGQSVAIAAALIFLLAAITAPLMGALAQAAGWDVLWATSAFLAIAGVLVASRLRQARPEPVLA